MIAIADTHVVLWWFEKPKRLSVAQRRVLAKLNDDKPLGVCDATLWEIALLVEAERVALQLPLDEWLARATAAPLVERIGMTPVIAREMIELASTRGWDPVDRILVASARVLGLPLVTSDQRIVDSGLVATVD